MFFYTLSVHIGDTVLNEDAKKATIYHNWEVIWVCAVTAAVLVVVFWVRFLRRGEAHLHLTLLTCCATG